MAVVGAVVSSGLPSAGGAADTDAKSEAGSADESVVSFGDLGYG